MEIGDGYGWKLKIWLEKWFAMKKKMLCPHQIFLLPFLWKIHFVFHSGRSRKHILQYCSLLFAGNLYEVITCNKNICSQKIKPCTKNQTIALSIFFLLKLYFK